MRRVEAGQGPFLVEVAQGEDLGDEAHQGDQLQGGPIAPSLRGPKWRHIDGTFEGILQRVRGGYPGSVMVAHPGGIDDAQTIQVATYVWAVSHGKAKP